jgi:hypothetical protein
MTEQGSDLTVRSRNIYSTAPCSSTLRFTVHRNGKIKGLKSLGAFEGPPLKFVDNVAGTRFPDYFVQYSLADQGYDETLAAVPYLLSSTDSPGSSISIHMTTESRSSLPYYY